MTESVQLIRAPLIVSGGHGSQLNGMATACAEHSVLHFQHPACRIGGSTTSSFLVQKSQSIGPCVLTTAACSPVLPAVVDEPVVDAVRVANVAVPRHGNFDQNLRKFLQEERTENSVLDFYRDAKKDPAFCLKSSSTSLFLSFLTKSEQWTAVCEVAADIGFHLAYPDAPTASRSVRICASSRKFRATDVLLESLSQNRETAAQASASAMRSYNRLHMYSNTVSLYERMVSFGIPTDSGCYRRVLEALEKTGNTTRLLEVFNEFRTQRLVWDEEDKPVYLAVCRSLANSGHISESIKLFRKMESSGIGPDSRFYACLISSLMADGRLEEAESLLPESKRKGCIPKDQSLYLRLVLARIESDMPEKSVDVVSVLTDSGMKVTDCVLSALIGGLMKRCGPRAALNAFDRLVATGLQPGQVSYALAVGACTWLGLVETAESLLSEMCAAGFVRCVFAYASIIRMYGRTGRLGDAVKMLGVMKAKGCSPNVWVYNALLNMYGRAGRVRQVERFWNEMQVRGVQPDRASYTSLISAYAKVKDLNACVRVYGEFRAGGGRLDRTLAAVMVGVLSKITRVDELVRFLHDVKDQGVTLDGRLYRSTMYALRDAGLQAQLKWFLKSFRMGVHS